MFTRDSLLWWLGILGAVIVYLSNAAPPSQWSWNDWMQALAFVVATLSGKLATSPLPGAPKSDQVRPSRFLGLLFLVLLVPGLAGCALTSKPDLPNVPPAPLSSLATFAQRVEQAGKIAEQAQQLEIGLYRLQTPGLTEPVHKGIQQSFLALAVAVQAGLDVAEKTLTEQSARDALATIATALERVERDAQSVTHPTVRSVLQTMVGTIRVVLQFLPTSSPAAALAEWERLYHRLSSGH